VIPALAIIYFEFPETKGRSFAELDEMFEGKVKTRKFRTYETNGHGVEE
jgi:MFS transporter, SP family, general alpha glucoside:H+ symporter